MLNLSPVERRLLNEYQRDFPLVPRPFAAIGSQLQISETRVMTLLSQLREKGAISRIGPVFSPGAIGSSLLAALAVPVERLDAVADWISGFPEINHNYQREHDFNLWFVVAAPHEMRLQELLDTIRSETGCALLALPLIEQFHIDLGFDLFATSPDKSKTTRGGAIHRVVLDDWQRALVASLQGGLAIVAQPYAALCEEPAQHGSAESRALEQIATWVDAGVIRRFGVVVRHHELGYRDNAMVVWDVADAQVAAFGAQAARHPAVTLCYRRPRQGTAWPYNLFCMVHGKDRETVRAAIADIGERSGLAEFPSQVLFSVRRFKQCGARYVANG
ncbi:MAG: Lrp/AsnC family transcriptional regulator [Burkholderiaceae bacterium]|nr:Lrp/AsnC family transcriptional regulator [Burkholderiaceae bacterium]